MLTGRPGESFAPGEILIDGPAIAHVGARGSAPERPGTDVTELPGCTLMPGLIDSHVHLGFDRAVDPHTRRSAESDAHRLLRMVENCRKLLIAGIYVCPTVSGVIWQLRDDLGEEWFDALLSRGRGGSPGSRRGPRT